MKYIIYDFKNKHYVEGMNNFRDLQLDCKTKVFKSKYAANKFIAQRLRSDYANYHVTVVSQKGEGEYDTIPNKLEELK